MPASVKIGFSKLATPVKGTVAVLTTKDMDLSDTAVAVADGFAATFERAAKAAGYEGGLLKTLNLLAPSGTATVDRIMVAGIGDPDKLKRKDWRDLGGTIGGALGASVQATLVLDRPDGKAIEIPGDITLNLVNGSVPGHGGKNVILGIRPEHFELAAESEEDVLPLRVDHVELLGADTLVHGHFGEDKNSLTLRLPDVQQFEKHTILPLVIPAPKLHLFDIESGRRIGD